MTRLCHQSLTEAELTDTVAHLQLEVEALKSAQSGVRTVHVAQAGSAG